jgi:hypothetical protein
MIRRALPTVCVALFLIAPRAAAQEAARQGWWTVTNIGGAIPGTATAPDVPPDGLLIQGGGESDTAPTAVAALAIPAPGGADVQTVVVHATSSTAVTPGSVIKACPLRSADFTPAQGGPISEAPAYDCANAKVASVGADGVTYSFAATGLTANGLVAVALVPGSPVTRVVLAKPGPDALGVARHGTSVTAAPAPNPPPPLAASWVAPFQSLEPSAAPAPAPSKAADTAAGSPSPALASYALPGTPATNTFAVLAVAALLAGAAYAWRKSAAQSAPRSGAHA